MEPITDPRPGEARRTGWGGEGHPEPRPLIEDHALIGDLHSAALVARDGSIDFLCLPDFDSDACFASLLGTAENGRWKLAPATPVRVVQRRYLPRTLILETDFETDEGKVRIVDFMPLRREIPRVIRLVVGLSGEVRMRSQLRPRFENGTVTPRMVRRDGTCAAVSGQECLSLSGGKGRSATPFEFDFTVRRGQRIPLVLSWTPANQPLPASIDPERALEETATFWEEWTSRIQLPGAYDDVVMRSLITLKACSFRPTGALVAAPTFGLPEYPGGERNWDYRYCWIRDASLTVNVFIRAGLLDEVRTFAAWLEEALAGEVERMQIMYGIRGKRRLCEVELEELQGYAGSRPVRIGNAAYEQFQLDVFGELALVAYRAARAAGELPRRARSVLEGVAGVVARRWKEPDHGLWEMRGPRRNFTTSRVACWVAIDRWLRTIDEYGLRVDKTPWEALRKTLFESICREGFDQARSTFTQSFGSKTLDASLLSIPLSGFLPPDDARVVGTVQAIERDLMEEGLVLRYRTEEADDGLPGEEGAFIACSFWLAHVYQRMGRTREARLLFEKVIGLSNDVGLLAEEYLLGERQLAGNFPQAFSHLALVNCAYTLAT